MKIEEISKPWILTENQVPEFNEDYHLWDLDCEHYESDPVFVMAIKNNEIVFGVAVYCHWVNDIDVVYGFSGIAYYDESINEDDYVIAWMPIPGYMEANDVE